MIIALIAISIQGTVFSFDLCYSPMNKLGECVISAPRLLGGDAAGRIQFGIRRQAEWEDEFKFWRQKHDRYHPTAPMAPWTPEPVTLIIEPERKQVSLKNENDWVPPQYLEDDIPY